PGHLASNRRYKHPFAIGLAKDFKAYNWKPMYDLLAVELREAGTFQIPGSNDVYRPELLTFIGDNKGVHEVAGLTTNFTSGAVCRWCYIHYDELHLRLRLATFDIRTKGIIREIL
ncbi:hypothetical protein PFISCL1PPCAC_28598, partial [Pristionchus fissidentatus]